MENLVELEPGLRNASCCSPEFMEKLQSVSLVPQQETSNAQETETNHEVERSTSKTNHEVERSASWRASQMLWATGELCEPIPDGFYCVILERRLKLLFETIPSPDQLNTLDFEGLKAEVIIVNTEKDKTLSMLKQLIMTSVKGLNSNPAAIVKKIAGLVCDFYKWPNSDLSPEKAAQEEISPANNQGILMLGQIRHSSCRARAILFKVLADTVGLDSKLMVGVHVDGSVDRTDSHKHISVTVLLNSMELLVDLMRLPGQLIPPSSKEIFMSHICPTNENGITENDSCSSPVEPNSPMCGFSERLDVDSSEHDEHLHSAYRRKLEASLVLRPKTSSVGKLNLDHPLSRGHGKSGLSSDKPSFKEFGNGLVASRSVGSIRPEARRRRRHSISMAPEIGDDVVRAVRALNETMKQDRMLREQGDVCCSKGEKEIDHQVNVSNYDPNDRANFSGLQKIRYSSQKAISLPSSPHKYRGLASQRNGPSDFTRSATMLSRCNELIESSKILDKLFLPYQEWNIDFSELTVGTRVGIGFFGEVFRGVWNGTDVAIKLFLEQDLTVENIEDFCNEISILSRVRHPNVILFLGACTKPPRLSMVTEFMDMGSLYYLIHVSGEKEKLSWRRRTKMLCDICRGLMCIHRMKIVHRDLKSANCLVNKHMTVKICDFGLSRVLTSVPMKDSSCAGTPEWMAPELIRNEPYTEKCDIFSLGVIIWELFTLKRPWEGVPGVQVVYAVANDGLRLEIPEGPVGKIISDCWAQPNKRPGCDEILSRLLECEFAHC